MKITKKQLTYLVENEVRKQLINNKKINESIIDDDTIFAVNFMNILEPYRQDYLQYYKWEIFSDTVFNGDFMECILTCTKGRYYYNTDIKKIQKFLDESEEIAVSIYLIKYTTGTIKFLEHTADKYKLYSEDKVNKKDDDFILCYTYYIPINKVIEILPDLLNDLATSSDLTYL